MVQIFTWHGATIELDGISEVEYVADEVILVTQCCLELSFGDFGTVSLIYF